MKVPIILYTKATENLENDIKNDLVVNDPESSGAFSEIIAQSLGASNQKESADA